VTRVSDFAYCTEVEWQAAEFWPPMLDHIRGRATTRQFLLLGVALCRRVWDRFPFDDCGRLVEAVERLADHPEVNRDDLPAIRTEVDSLFERLRDDYDRVDENDIHTRGAYLASLASGHLWYDTDGAIESIASAAATSVAGAAEGPAWEAERQAQARLLRELFGNPFRPVAFAPSWRTDTAVSLAAGIDAERAFDRLPILADALEEAGCDHPDVLAHCREPGPHARGCWVVDLVLAKS
jgi:hypothetical protein